MPGGRSNGLELQRLKFTIERSGRKGILSKFEIPSDPPICLWLDHWKSLIRKDADSCTGSVVLCQIISRNSLEISKAVSRGHRYSQRNVV